LAVARAPNKGPRPEPISPDRVPGTAFQHRDQAVDKFVETSLRATVKVL